MGLFAVRLGMRNNGKGLMMRKMTQMIPMTARQNGRCRKAFMMMAGCLFAAVSQAALLSEDFSDNERATQNLPSSAAWYSSGSSDKLSAATGDLVATSGNHSLAYFTEAGSPHQLENVGDSITASFTVSMKNPKDGQWGGMYIGMFNSEGTRVDADEHTTGNSAFGSDRYQGYGTYLIFGSSKAMKLLDRNTGSSSLLNTGSAFTMTGTLGTGATIVSDQDYAATMTFSRTTNGVHVSFSFDNVPGYTGSWEDTVDAVTAFDTFGIYSSSSSSDEYTIKDLTVRANAVIPEGDLLAEDFSDNERLTQDLPDSSTWYSSGSSDSLSASTGDLVSTSSCHSLTYFTPSGCSHELDEVGDSITASFTVSMKNPTDGQWGGMYLGMFDSEGTRVAADSHSTDNSAFGSDRYQGYGAWLIFGQSKAMKLMDRNQGSTSLLNTGSAFTMTGTMGTGATIESNVDYAATLSFTRTANGVSVYFALDDVAGYEGTWTDTNDVATAFDTFAVYSSSSSSDSYTIKELTITATEAVQEGDLLVENFSDNERSTQGLPNSTAWYSSGSSDKLSAATGDLVSISGNHALTYFTTSGSPQALGDVGDSITASFTFSLENPVDRWWGMYIGLFNSNEERIAADGLGTWESEFQAYQGYGATLAFNQDVAMKLLDRNKGDGSLLNTSGAFTMTSEYGTGTTFVSGQDYHAVLTLIRTFSGVEVSFALEGVSGYEGTWVDTEDVETDFDTFAIYASASGSDTYTIKELTISVSEGATVVPDAPVVSFDGSFGDGQDVISWETIQGYGFAYNVYYTTDLLDGFQPLETNLVDTVQSLTNYIDAPSVFYKIEINSQD